MRWLAKSMFMLALVGLGYALGASGPQPALLRAQADGEGPDLTPETIQRIAVANDALRAATTSLIQENRYVPAVEGLNAFAVTVGGLDAMAGLESGQGVDPETFAALYAGLAIEEVADHLDFDPQGRLMYKNKIVRLYPISRLKQMYADRVRLSAVEASR